MVHKPLFLLCVCIYHFSSSGMYISECSILGYRGDGFGCDLNGVSGIKNQHFSHTILSKKHVFSRQMSHKSTPVAFSDSPSFAILLILLTFPIAGTIREAIKFKKQFFKLDSLTYSPSNRKRKQNKQNRKGWRVGKGYWGGFM